MKKDMNYTQVAELISKAKYPIAFTGAGISVESGIPPFRGQGGLWNKYDPDFLTLMPTPANSDDDLRRVEAALLSVPRRAPLPNCAPPFHVPLQSIRLERQSRQIPQFRPYTVRPHIRQRRRATPSKP